MAQENSYLGEVLEQQQRVDMELKAKRRSVSPMSNAGPMPSPAQAPQAVGGQAAAVFRRQVANMQAEEFDAGGRAIDYRITGFGRWKTVVVPPNVYVVHTRRGVEKPLHIGMGISFAYNPYRDAFLVIPAAMQTIIINARCICMERQGILVQAYVQWIIDNISTAYKKLDFSDAEDPMRVVNVQLREQAEAAIKDKVSTMHIDEVLADKQPIIEELTTRLRTVAEGTDGGGLGLKIVTVQIKEAVVSSTRLWENLQKPFRAERERTARMAELETERQISSRELEIRQARESAEIATEREIEKARAEQEREGYDRTQAEAARRATLELETERKALLDRNATEKAKREAELELALKNLEIARRKVEAEIQTLAEQKKLDAAGADRARAQIEAETALMEIKSKAAAAIAEREIAQLKAKRAVENDVSANLVRAQMIANLPQIASKLPVPKELKSVTISGDGGNATTSLTGLLATVMSLVEGKNGQAPEADAPPAAPAPAPKRA
ncbi:MAG TPA: SPFH domain-containing protein [bacterium]|nr:SPFH domain-containing protein [bacterium]